MRFIRRAAAALAGVLLAAPAFAHHGKDFLITATDDMPLRGLGNAKRRRKELQGRRLTICWLGR